MNQNSTPVTQEQDAKARVQILARQIVTRGMSSMQEMNHEGSLAMHIGCAFEGWVTDFNPSQKQIDDVITEMHALGFNW